ncbi:MAG: DUF624 domain-containing protein [Clostridia bacterium]|nr:DUF624 domain-containing protein [Clostridia bacterium]
MSIFEYDSKFMTFLRTVGDLIILNVLYLVCSIPLFTIGAAQAGLYTGLRELFDRDGSNSSAKSFFKGFRNGFGKITAIWSAILVSLLLLSYSVYYLYFAIKEKIVTTNVPIIVAIVGIVILCLLSAQLTIFHSKFDCSASLLIKNTIVMTIGFPLRSLLMAIMIYLPIAVILMDGGITFIRATPLWIAIYFSLVFLLNNTLMKKPYIKTVPGEAENEEAKKEKEKENKTQ